MSDSAVSPIRTLIARIVIAPHALSAHWFSTIVAIAPLLIALTINSRLRTHGS